MSEQEQEEKPEEEEDKPQDRDINDIALDAGKLINEANEVIAKEEKKEAKKPTVKTPEMDDRFKKFWKELGEQANMVSQANFEQLIITDEYQFNGAVYKAKRLTYKEKHELYLLQQKARELSENENWEEWYENQKNRAILLIEDMTPERFETEDSYILTSLISAWGLKPEGFRDLFKST